MIWVPWLSLLVFCIAMLFSIFYGFKKGWVYALSFSITLWLITLGFVFINYLIYKYLWEIFWSFIISSKPNTNIDSDNLSKFYKLQIIILAIGIESIFIYPITFFIMFLVNKFLIKKYFGHKVKGVSKSEKQIVFRRKINISRFGGVIILGTSTLFSGSLIASSFNTIFTPYTKNNIANSVNDFFGEIYSLKLGKNSKSSQIISNFIKKNLDSKMANAMRSLTKFESSLNKERNSFPSIEKIRYLISKKDDFVELLKDNDASMGIFSSVIHSKSKELDPFVFDREIALKNVDSKNNVIGYAINRNNYANDINDFENFLNENNLNFVLSETINKFLRSKMKEKIIPFEKTIFYENYHNYLLLLKNYQNDLVLRRKEKAGEISRREEAKKARGQTIKWLKQMVGNSYSMKGDLNKEDSIDFNPKTINRSLPGNGAFKSEVIAERALKTKRDESELLRNNKQKAFDRYIKNTYNPSRNELQEAESNYRSSLYKLQSLESKLQLVVNGTKVEMQNLKGALEKEIQRINQEIGTKEEEKKGATDAQIRILNDEIDKLKAKKLFLEDQVEIKTNYDNQKIIINDLLESWEQKKAEFPSIEREHKRLGDEWSKENDVFLKADQALSEKRFRVYEMISSYNSNIATLNTQNEIIKIAQDWINILNARNLKFDSPSFEIPQSDKFPANDDGSIYYYQKAIQYMKARARQKERIKLQKEARYNILKIRIMENYANWLERK